MGHPCSSCTHPQVREINHRIREERPLADISRWLDELDTPITTKALARHAKSHLGEIPKGGRRPISGNFLKAVVDTAHQGIEDGTLNVTVRDGISAQAELNRQADRSADRDLMVKIAIALTGSAPLLIEDPEYVEIEAEFRPLLTDGDHRGNTPAAG